MFSVVANNLVGPSFPLDEEGKLIIEGGDSVLGNVITPPIPE
jgi:hypothetical protein